MIKMTMLAAAVGLSVLMNVGPVLAGGPVIVPEETMVADEHTSRGRGNAVPIIVGLIIACAILCDGGDDHSPVTPPGPVCNSGC